MDQEDNELPDLSVGVLFVMDICIYIPLYINLIPYLF